MNAMNAFWFIPLDEESEKPMAFQMHKIALYANNMAAKANTLEEIFEIYKALFTTLTKADWHSHQIQ